MFNASYFDPFQLREEARKAWDHVVSDKVVYFADAVWPHDGRPPFFYGPKNYFRRKFWLEIQIAALRGNFYYVVVIEGLRPKRSFEIFRHTAVERIEADWYSSVLPNISERFENPQRVRFIGVPSLVRLKAFNKVNGVWRHVSTPLKDASRRPLLNDRKASRTCKRRLCQLPGQMIQSETKAIKALSKNKPQTWRRYSSLDLNNIHAVFDFLFCGGYRIALKEGSSFLINSCKVFLRPSEEYVEFLYGEHRDVPDFITQPSVGLAGLQCQQFPTRDRSNPLP